MTKVFKLLFAAVLGLALILPMNQVQAQEKSYLIEDWQAKLEVQENGDMLVTEQQTVRFTGSFSFYIRSISHQRLDDIEDVQVYDETADRQLREGIDYLVTDGYSGSYPSTDVHLNFALTNAVQTWTITYTVKGGLGFFEDHDEIYWNVIPSDRSIPILNIGATVALPSDVGQDNLKFALYENGVADAQGQVLDGQTVKFSGGEALPYTDFTLVVGWPPGIIERPGVIRVESTPDNADVYVNGSNTFLNTPIGLRTGLELRGEGPWHIQVKKYGITSQASVVNIEPGEVLGFQLEVFDTFLKKLLYWSVISLIIAYILLPVWLTIILILRWRKTGRDPKGRGTIIAEFEPPDNAIPSIVGTLHDERADLKDITAGIIDLAVRGYLEINELPKDGRFSSQNYEFVKKKPFDDPVLSAFEKELLDDLFGGKEKKKLSELKRRFYSKLPTLRKILYEDVARMKYFTENPDTRRKKYTAAASIMISLGFTGIFFFGLGIPLMLGGIVVAIFSRLAPQRTKQGVLANEKAAGFKLYLNTAERYVVRKMTPETFERFLAYAMVFGIEKKWAEKFKDIYKDIEPDWYHSSTGQTFNSILLANSISNWATASNTAMLSTPGGGSSSSGFGGFSSGSSGFSGGFSGGGGGGGGVSAG